MSFVTQNGQHELLFVPFGICNSPAVFTRYSLIQKGIVLTYMDDVIIPSKDVEEGIEKLKIFLEVASKFGLRIKWSKCQFLCKKVNFLGYVIENSSIKPSV